MKYLFTFLIVFSTLFFSCKYKEKPVFIGIEKIEIQEVTQREITFKANALFKNDNDIGGKLVTENIDVFADGILVGQLKTEEFNIPKRDTFAMPLEGKFSTEKILEKGKQDILNSVLTIISAKKIPISFKGDLQFKKGPFNYTYHVDHTDEVRIKF